MIQLGQNQGVLTELYKPIGDELKWIVVPKLFAERAEPHRVQSARRQARTDRRRKDGAVRLRWGASSGGTRHCSAASGATRDRRRFALATRRCRKAPFDGGEWFVDGTWDRIDNRYFPSRGTYADFEYLWSRTCARRRQRIRTVRGLAVHGENVGTAHVPAGRPDSGSRANGEAPIQNIYLAGGIFRLSGFEPDELSGQNFGMALLGYRYKLFATGWLPPYVGMTLEYGNTARAGRRHPRRRARQRERLHGLQLTARAAVHRLRIRARRTPSVLPADRQHPGQFVDRRLSARLLRRPVSPATGTFAISSASVAALILSSIINTRATLVSGRNLRNFFR